MFPQLSCEVSFIPPQRTDKGIKKTFSGDFDWKTIDFKDRNEDGSSPLNPISLLASNISLLHQPSSKQSPPT